METVTETVRKSTSEVLEPQVRYYISSLRYEAPNVEQVLHRAVRQHWTIENKGHWALDMAFNQDRLQCTNAQYLAGRTLLNKIALNFTTKIQTRLEEATGKAAPSKPIIRARLRKIEGHAGRHERTAVRILKVPRVRSPIKGDLYRGSLLNFWCVRPGGSPIKVNLSIKNGKIADVKFTHNETPAVGGSALDKIKADVLKSQNINVDAISGCNGHQQGSIICP